MERSFIQLNAVNTITIVLMVAVGYMVIMFMAVVLKRAWPGLGRSANDNTHGAATTASSYMAHMGMAA